MKNSIAGRRSTRKVPVSRRSTKTSNPRSTLSRVGPAVLAKTQSKLGFGKRRKNPMARKFVRGAMGGQATFSKWFASRPVSPRAAAMKKVGAANYYVTNAASQLSVLGGYQRASSYGFQTIDDLKAIGQTIWADGSLNAQPKQYLLESATAEYMITNSTLATMYVDIYDIVRKRDVKEVTDPAGYNPTLLPELAWQSGLGSQSNSPTNPNIHFNINSLPTDSRMFKEYFKVVQRNHIGLAQGATHRHSVKLKSNELVDTALTATANGDLAGLTVYTMIVSYGQPVSVIGETPTITTADGNIDIVRAVRYKFSWVQDYSNTFTFLDNLSSFEVGAQVVSAGAGVIVPNQKV